MKAPRNEGLANQITFMMFIAYEYLFTLDSKNGKLRRV